MQLLCVTTFEPSDTGAKVNDQCSLARGNAWGRSYAFLNSLMSRKMQIAMSVAKYHEYSVQIMVLPNRSN